MKKTIIISFIAIIGLIAISATNKRMYSRTTTVASGNGWNVYRIEDNGNTIYVGVGDGNHSVSVTK